MNLQPFWMNLMVLLPDISPLFVYSGSLNQSSSSLVVYLLWCFFHLLLDCDLHEGTGYILFIFECSLIERKVMTNLDTILKSREITLSPKVCLVKAMVFPVVMYGCESWTVKKAEHWRVDAFELWCWRRFLRGPRTARRSIQSILKEISPEYSLELNIHAEAEASIRWPPVSKNWLIGIDPDAGKDWRWEKGMTEDEMVGWYHWLNGHKFE